MQRNIFNLTTQLAWLTACIALSGCGGNSDSPAPAPSGPDTATRTLAATTTAQSSSNACAAIQPFYWETGDRTQRLASGSVNQSGNATTYTADTLMSIASASKWLYSAYVAERRSGMLSAQDIQFLTFNSGYTGLAPIGDCTPTDTIASCVARGDNDLQTPAHVDRFYYNGGHMQKHASLSGGMNLGAMDNAALAAELRRLLGSDISLSYSQPQPAGGVRTTASDYARFLRKLLNNQLHMAALLGSNKVCTNPATCPTALNTPITNGLNWNYASGHWVEDDATRGDGAFSSAGAFGFYPWVDVSKTWYGIVARSDAFGGGNESADCGALIRKAWVTGSAL
ncbi:MAG: hypothetical protein H7Y33_18415 [Cytophagales bacterium]|nr:hypothetical protein [Rhizobacter sp.]